MVIPIGPIWRWRDPRTPPPSPNEQSPSLEGAALGTGAVAVSLVAAAWVGYSHGIVVGVLVFILALVATSWLVLDVPLLGGVVLGPASGYIAYDLMGEIGKTPAALIGVVVACVLLVAGWVKHRGKMQER